MADIFDFYVYDDRSIRYELAEPIMLEDKNVTQFRFRIPKNLNGFDMTDWEWWFIFVNPNGTKYNTLLELIDDEDEPDEYSIATYTVGYGFSGIVGTVRFSIEALNVSGEEIVNEWHTKTYSTAVIDTLQGLRAIIPEPEGQTIESLISNLDARVTALEAGGSGLTQQEKNLIMQLFSKAAYAENDAGTAYTALSNLWTGYSITWSGTGYTKSNSAIAVSAGSSFTSTITANTGFNITAVTVTMGGTEVEGAWSSGTVTIPNVTGNIVITVTTSQITVSSISAVYTQSGTVYDTDSLDSLKSDLVVTATFMDSSTGVIDAADYTLSGTLAEGTSVVTVSYGGKTATFSVVVTDPNVIDYTINPLEGVTWHDGYTYNRNTGVLTATANEHCTDKFSAQSCIYILANADTTNNRYVAIFAWDENGAYLGELQYNASVFSLKREYKYALKVFNSATFDSSTITFMPKNNTATATSEFEIKLSDYVGNITATNANYYEINVASVMSGAGVTADNIGTKINKCNHLAVLTPVSTTLNFVNRDFAFWFYNINTMLFRVKDIPMKDLTGLEAYIAANNPTIRFNY